MKNTHEFYMNIARLTAEQSRAKRLKVGCVLVKGNNIISFGYNGTPKGFDNCCETMDGEKEITKPEVLHAESNAIVKCAIEGISSKGSILYTTHSPCLECCKLIIQAGIEKVVYANMYRDTTPLELLDRALIRHWLIPGGKQEV